MKTKTYYSVELCLYAYTEVTELEDGDQDQNLEVGDILDSDLEQEDPFFRSEDQNTAYETLHKAQEALEAFANIEPVWKMVPIPPPPAEAEEE